MAVFALQMEHFEQRFQLVLLQAGLEQSRELQRVEDGWSGDGREAAPVAVVAQHLPVEIHVVAEQHAAVGIVEEALQGLRGRQLLVVAQLLDDGIVEVAQFFGDGAVGLQIDVELRTLDHLALPQAHGGNLHDVVGVDVGSGGFRVENDDVAMVVGLEKLLEIAAVVIDEKIARQHGVLAQQLHKIAGVSIGGHHAESPQEPRPRNEIMFVGQHVEVRQQQFYFFRREKVLARHFEVLLPHFLQLLADAVGVVVGIHDDGRGFLGIGFGEHLRHVRGIVVFGFERVAAENA